MPMISTLAMAMSTEQVLYLNGDAMTMTMRMTMMMTMMMTMTIHSPQCKGNEQAIGSSE